MRMEWLTGSAGLGVPARPAAPGADRRGGGRIHNHLHSSDDAAPAAAALPSLRSAGRGNVQRKWRRYRVRLTVWLRPPEPTVPGGRAGRGGLGFADLAAAARVTAAGVPAPGSTGARAVPEPPESRRREHEVFPSVRCGGPCRRQAMANFLPRARAARRREGVATGIGVPRWP